MDWLMNETYSNYLIFLLGLIIGLITEVVRARLQKQKPSIIQVEKERDTSLISISPDVRSQLAITYLGKIALSGRASKKINELRQVTFSITNIGDNSIQNIEFGINLSDTNTEDLLDVVIDDPLYDNRDIKHEFRYTPEGDIGLRIIIPFLNPYKPHSDTIKAQIYSSKAINTKGVLGGGLGWSVRYFDRVAYNAKLEKIMAKSSSPLESIFLRTVARLIAR